ncbi:hypothetical protein [Latilactobacillus curvatus]
MNLKNLLKNNDLIYSAYKYYKYDRRAIDKYTFVDRKKNSDHVCIILAGYKDFLWDDVFGRLLAYYPENWDVCVMSAGMFSERLDKICKKNNWSYLATKRNNLSLIQNIAIKEFSKAKYIYKMDEDIFVTKNIFGLLENGLLEVENNSEYIPGYVAPIINVNSFTYSNILRKYGLLDVYSKKYGVIKRRGSLGPEISTNPDVAKFMWDGDGALPQIDEIALEYSKEQATFEACSIRFNIGLILFRRELWTDMKMFPIHKGNGLGKDEEDLDVFCMLLDRPAMIIKNSFVGHLGYGPQAKKMKKYYFEHKEIFEMGE